MSLWCVARLCPSCGPCGSRTADTAVAHGPCRRRSIQAKTTLCILLVANLIDRLFASGALVETVRTVEHNPLLAADVLVSVYHAGWDDEQHWLVGADDVGLMRQVGRRRGPVVPEVHLEVAR